jgi:hypothetical protein
MITKKRKLNKYNKTKKKYTSDKIPTSLQSSINASHNEDTREKSLACYLANNEKVKKFAYKIFCYMLFYWKKNYPREWKQIISKELLEKINENKIIEKIGFTSREKNIIFTFIDKNNKNELIEYLDDKFFKVTSVINNLSKPELTFYHVNVNKTLQNEFIRNLEKLFLVKNFDWNKFVGIYNSVPKKYKKSYNFFLFNIIVYGSNDEQNMSLYKKNLVYSDFIKKSLPENKKNKKSFLKKINNCNKSTIVDENYNQFSIYDARNFYEIDKNMPYAKIMNDAGDKYLAGPSGSTAILYINLFKFYSFPQTKEHKIMLLCVIIADYIPLWHTLTEILLSANIELQSYGIPNYNLEKNPLEFVYNLIKSYI